MNAQGLEKSGVNITGCYSAVFLPAIGIGLQDSVSPRSLTVLLVFAILLSAWSSDIRRTRWLGLTFILAVSVSSLLELMGFFDGHLNIPSFDVALKTINSFIGLCFVVVGAFHFWDWIQLAQGKRDDNLKAVVPSVFLKFFGRGKKKKFLNFKLPGQFLLTGVKTFFFACFIYLVGIYWPHDYYLYLMYYFAAVEGKLAVGLISFVAYALTICLPLYLIWRIAMARYVNQGVFFQKYISTIKIILSAVFLSVGIGVNYVVLN